VWRIPNDVLEGVATPDGALFQRIRNAIGEPVLERGAYSSVLQPDTTERYLEVLTRRLRLKDAQWTSVKPVRHSALLMGDYPPQQLGADRYANIVAAVTLRPNTAVAIVDSGTATTIDWVDAEGRYQGGVIVPGLWTFWQTLHQTTARLPLVPLGWAHEYPGKSTQSAMQAGLSVGYAGMLQALIAENPLSVAEVVLTGGSAERLHAWLTRSPQAAPYLLTVEPHWTLLGIASGSLANEQALPVSQPMVVAG
jgi:pantothenate kinase type III